MIHDSLNIIKECTDSTVIHNIHTYIHTYIHTCMFYSSQTWGMTANPANIATAVAMAQYTRCSQRSRGYQPLHLTLTVKTAIQWLQHTAISFNSQTNDFSPYQLHHMTSIHKMATNTECGKPSRVQSNFSNLANWIADAN